MTNARTETIIAIAVESHEVLPDPTDLELFDCVEDCTGWQLTKRERRLVKVAFDNDAETARASFDYYA